LDSPLITIKSVQSSIQCFGICTYFTPSGSVGEGSLPSQPPDVGISLPASRFPKLLKGELSVFHAYMCGDLKVDGDTSCALKLEEVMTIMMNQIGMNKQ
jgi:putative sterol carrier protein